MRESMWENTGTEYHKRKREPNSSMDKMTCYYTIKESGHTTKQDVNGPSQSATDERRKYKMCKCYTNVTNGTCTEWPQMTFTTRSKYPTYLLLVSPSPKFHCFPLWPAVFKLDAISRKVHQWPLNDLDHYKFSYPTPVTSVPTSQISLCVPLYHQPLWFPQ